MATAVSREQGYALRHAFEARGHPRAPDVGTASHLFRIAQEAVRNALRHAQARQIEILLLGDASHLTLTVSDDGPGRPREDRMPGLGLRIMAHRAEILGGDLAIESVDGGGTRVRCRVPLRAAAA